LIVSRLGVAVRLFRGHFLLQKVKHPSQRGAIDTLLIRCLRQGRDADGVLSSFIALADVM
jgi:hypothetical protein